MPDRAFAMSGMRRAGFTAWVPSFDREREMTTQDDAIGAETHGRKTATRGLKRTPYQDPRVTIGPATVVMIPEYKSPSPEIAIRGAGSPDDAKSAVRQLPSHFFGQTLDRWSFFQYFHPILDGTRSHGQHQPAGERNQVH